MHSQRYGTRFVDINGSAKNWPLTVNKKTWHCTFARNVFIMLTDLKNSFTVRRSRKFATESLSIARSACLPSGLYVLLMFFVYFFSVPTSRHVISKTTRPIFTKFAGLIVVWERLINCSFILQSLKGRCHGNQFFGQIFEIGRPHLYSL